MIELSSPLDSDTNVVFLIDGSLGVSSVDFRRQKEFVKSLWNHFAISSDGPRASAVVYGYKGTTIADFRDPKFNKLLDNATLPGTPRRMDNALGHAARILSSTRGGSKKIVVLLTTGKSQPSARSFGLAVKPLVDIGAQIYIVAVGTKTDNQDLVSAVERPYDLFPVKMSKELLFESSKIARQIRDRICKLMHCAVESRKFF